MEPMARARFLRIVLVVTAFGLLAAVLVGYFARGFVPGDAIVYLAAGERLNAGHLLYALSPGDRIVALKPPYWTVPTLSPPFMGVLFRPLALLPPDLGAYVWWFATVSTIAATLVVLVRRIPVLTSIAVLALGVPIVYEIGVGNVNAFLLAGSIAIWYSATRGHGRIAGALAAFLVMVKIWPIALVWWLVVQRRADALRAGLATGVVLVVISVLGAGIQAHFTYFQVIRDTASQGTSDLSVAGLARSVGVPAAIAGYLPWVVFLGGCALAWLFRARRGLSFSCAIVAMVLGSSVVNINSYALLLAALAPAAWPAPERSEENATFSAALPGGEPGLVPTQPQA
jgi:Glycosyltransferase family 87